MMQVLHHTSASARMRGGRNASQQALLGGQRREINQLLTHCKVTPLQASSASTLPSSIRIPEMGGVLGAGTCCGTVRCRKGGSCSSQTVLFLPSISLS